MCHAMLQVSKGVRSQGDMPPCAIAFPVTNEQKGEDPNCSEGEALRLPAIRRQPRKAAAESKASVDPLVTPEALGARN